MKTIIISAISILSVMLFLSGCRGAPLPSYHSGEDSIYGQEIHLVSSGQSKNDVKSILGSPTRTYQNWAKSDIERNMKKDFDNPPGFYFSEEGTFDLWYYHAKRHESYTIGIQNTYVTRPKWCYFTFNNEQDKLVWHHCQTASD